MNNTTTYDIFELAEDLKKAGVNEAAIKAQIKFEKAKDEVFTTTLATKKDIEDLKIATKKDLELALKDQLLKLCYIMGGMSLAVITILDFLLKK